MSYWTHLAAAIDIDCMRITPDAQTYVEKMLEGAPKITGSEGNCDVFVNVRSGHNCSTNKDCARCPHSEIAFPDCPVEGKVDCPSGEYQTQAVITVAGDLRDRERWQTHREWKAFQKYIARKFGCGFQIRNCACRISGY